MLTWSRSTTLAGREDDGDLLEQRLARRQAQGAAFGRGRDESPVRRGVQGAPKRDLKNLPWKEARRRRRARATASPRSATRRSSTSTRGWSRSISAPCDGPDVNGLATVLNDDEAPPDSHRPSRTRRARRTVAPMAKVLDDMLGTAGVDDGRIHACTRTTSASSTSRTRNLLARARLRSTSSTSTGSCWRDGGRHAS